MANPYFLNISIIFFLFLSYSGPSICFTIATSSSWYYPTFSLCKTSQRFVKTNDPSNANIRNLYWFLLGIVLCHSITDVELFRWFKLVEKTTLVIILSNMLIFLMSHFDEFVNLHGILFGKCSLWSLMAIYDLLSYIHSMRSSIESCFAIDFVLLLTS